MIPWAALSFLTMYFQYIGMSNVRAGAIGSTITLFCAFGAVTGGLVADRLTKWYQIVPIYACIVAAQCPG